MPRGVRAAVAWGALALVLAAPCTPAADDGLTVATAANFLATAKRLDQAWQAAGHAPLTLVAGATGGLYAQIRQGAPYDVFLAADQRRPRRLLDEGHAVADSRVSYALGRLMLWSAQPGRAVEGPEALDGSDLHRLAIANPRTAPYGAAAAQALRALGRWDALRNRLVRAKNVGQAFQLAASASVPLAFVARSQVTARGADGSGWLVPDDLHEPLVQDAVAVRDRPGARAFLAFLTSERGASIIRESGYEIP